MPKRATTSAWILLICLGIGAAAAAGLGHLFPKMVWWAYPVITLIVALILIPKLLQPMADRAIVDGSAPARPKSKLGIDEYDSAELSGGNVSKAIPSLSGLSAALAQIPNGSGRIATENQIRAVRRLRMGEPNGLSMEQASALLSAKRYSEGVIYAEIGEMDGYDDERLIEATLVDFIIGDPALRDRVIAWSARSFARGGADVPKPKKDEHYFRVQARLRELLDIA